MFKKLRNKKCKSKISKKTIRKFLGFNPKNQYLYELALTHKSAESPCMSDYDNNERLEFLGDAILDSVISEILYRRFPSADEGFLTKMRTKIVNGKKLSELAEKTGLKELIIKDNRVPFVGKILEDAFEAFIGAIFIDKGYKYVKRFIGDKIFIKHIDLNKLKHVESNYKSRLIEWAQAKKYSVVFSTDYNPDNVNVFISEIKIASHKIGEGIGNSKKEAEQNAAKQGLGFINNNPETVFQHEDEINEEKIENTENEIINHE